ncbi:ndufs4 NADH dehydrogenase Fe-S protein subunit, variant 2 [Entomophthora muscae]|uniref:Ndufs4 NADH dehydrogenase Fe-S protein subunit, variant 2 n=1 Tax=Entomophthora muscae TaxID=34485 RepID=A0ACC2SE37_9FUNG|nr:ndufs4 NADH dehydrogenase Fe-S protein subunit, variant 2 [Entomophthora muscae]
MIFLLIFTEELKSRNVLIYQPAKTAMQSGTAGTKHWKLDFDILEGSGRWTNSLMGWASSADPLQALKIDFKTKEQAILFAEKQGWNYSVQEPKQRAFRKKLYADNFIYSGKKLRFQHTK